MARFKQDDVVILTITDYGMDCEGIARIDEFVFFVPYTVKGETVKAKITYVKKNLVFANLVEVIEPSSDRVKPLCNRFTRCGGCDCLHIDYNKQLEIKKNHVATLFKKNTNLDVTIDDVVPSKDILGYRNKIQLPFGTVNGKVAMGFFKTGTHKIVSITKCFLHGEWVEKLILCFVEYANKYNVSAYDEGTKKGILRHLVVRHVDNQYCITVVTNNADLPNVKALINMITEAIGENFSLYVSKKKSHDNVIMGESVKVIKQREFIVDILGIKLTLNPYSFLQLNDDVRDKIYSRVVEEITNASGKKVAIDAYAGVGALGAVLAKNGVRVYNIEIVKEATEDGILLAKNNGVEEYVTNVNGDASKEIGKAIDYALTLGVDKPYIILDPPRKGCDERVINAIKNISTPHTIFYISCNPATLTRDLNRLCIDNNYNIEYVTPYDMFPNTKHVETVVCLKRQIQQ